MANVTKIQVQSEFNGRGLTAADAALDKTAAKTKNLANEGEKVKKAFSIGDGFKFSIADRTLGALQQIPNIIKDGVMQGVMFNAEMGDAEVAIGNVLQKFGGLNKEASKNAAAQAMQQIIDLEPRVSGGVADMVQGLMATLSSAQSVGMSIEQNIDLVGRFANGLANAKIPAEQLSQEMRAVFGGNITPDAAFAKIIGVTNADVEEAKRLGTLYDMLVEKIGTLGEAGDTFGVRWSSFQSAMDKTLATATKPFFDELSSGLLTATAILNDGKLIANVRELATATGMLIDVGRMAGEADGMMGLNPKGILGAIGEWKKWSDHMTGIPALLKTFDDLFRAPAKELNLGTDMAAAVGLVDNAKRADGPEAQAKARLAIEERIQSIKQQVAKGEIENSGLVKTTLAYLEKSLTAWNSIAGRSAELKEDVVKTVAPSKEQATAMEKTAAAAERASAALDSQLDARGDRLASDEERLQRLSDRMVAMRDELNRDYLQAGGAASIDGLDPERTRSQIDAGGIDDEAKAALLTKLGQILDLEEAITAEANKQHQASLERLQTEDEKARVAAETLADLEDNLRIETALTAGHSKDARLLEIQRDLRKELAEITASDLAPADKERAADLAKQTAEMQKQKALADEAKKAQERAARLEEIQAENATKAERAKGHKTGTRRAEDREYEIKRRNELEKEGFDQATIDSTIEGEMATRRRERGTIGGPTKRSEPDTFGNGLTADEEWKKKFGGGSGGMGGTALDKGRPKGGFGGGLTAQSEWDKQFKPGASGSALDQGRPTGGFGGGLTAQSDWDKKFPKPAPEAPSSGDPGQFDINPPSPYNDPNNPLYSEIRGLGPTLPQVGQDGIAQVADGGPGSTGGGGPVEAIERAGEAGQTAGKGLTEAGKKLEKSMKDVEKTASKDFGSVATAIDSMRGTLESKLTDMASRIEALENSVSNI